MPERERRRHEAGIAVRYECPKLLDDAVVHLLARPTAAAPVDDTLCLQGASRLRVLRPENPIGFILLQKFIRVLNIKLLVNLNQN